MLYQPLQTQSLHLAGRASLDGVDCGECAVLIPNPKSKIFVHWLTEKGNIRSTYTMEYATQIEGTVRLINGLDKETDVLLVKLA